jgi:hypothetical protein
MKNNFYKKSQNKKGGRFMPITEEEARTLVEYANELLACPLVAATGEQLRQSSSVPADKLLLCATYLKDELCNYYGDQLEPSERCAIDQLRDRAIDVKTSWFQNTATDQEYDQQREQLFSLQEVAHDLHEHSQRIPPEISDGIQKILAWRPPVLEHTSPSRSERTSLRPRPPLTDADIRPPPSIEAYLNSRGL